MPQVDFRSPRLFIDAPLAAGASLALDRNQSNYLGNVLRLGTGDPVLVFNGRDGEWRASIAGRKRPDHLSIESQVRPQDRLPDLAYVFAPLKHARLDYMAQKAVEMGVEIYACEASKQMLGWETVELIPDAKIVGAGTLNDLALEAGATMWF